MNKDVLLVGGKSSSVLDSVGVAGEMGFGVGVCHNEEDLAAMELTPMDGCDDPSSENYGNYQHSNGSIMVYVPAFCCRIGQPTAPSYERDGANALEIGAPELDGTDNWILHRAFIDGGEKKSGFFMDKYLCSKSTSDSNIAVSVKNAEQISLSSSTYINSSSMAGCSGVICDAITLSRARGDQYACVSAFQWSAIAMLSLAHGQAVTSAENCAWYDSGYITNFPKGSNTSSKTDANDPSVTYSRHIGSSSFGRTGSGTPFAKTTHNGQSCGICDINGVMLQPLLGIVQSGTSGTYMVAKESFRVHDFTTSNYDTSSNFDSYDSGTPTAGSKRYFGNGTNCAFFTASSGAGRALCGVIPTSSGSSSGGTNMFGNDCGYYKNVIGLVVVASGSYSHGSIAGVWFRDGHLLGWLSEGNDSSFRAAGYPPSVAPWGG